MYTTTFLEMNVYWELYSSLCTMQLCIAHHTRRAGGNCWGSNGCRETLEVCEAQGTSQGTLLML